MVPSKPRRSERLQKSLPQVNLREAFFPMSPFHIHGSWRKSTFPPERITPTRQPAKSPGPSRKVATGTADEGSMVISIRS